MCCVRSSDLFLFSKGTFCAWAPFCVSCLADSRMFKENGVIALAYHLVWYSAHKAAEGGNTERAEKVRAKVRENLMVDFTPLQITELVWRVSMCVALICNNDFLVGDDRPLVAGSAASAAAAEGEVVLDPQARFRAHTVSSSPHASPRVSPGGSPLLSRQGSGGGAAGRAARPRSSSSSVTGSPVGRGRGGTIAMNPYEDK